MGLINPTNVSGINNISTIENQTNKLISPDSNVIITNANTSNSESVQLNTGSVSTSTGITNETGPMINNDPKIITLMPPSINTDTTVVSNQATSLILSPLSPDKTATQTFTTASDNH